MIFIHESTLNCEAIESRIEKEADAFGLKMKKHFPFSTNLPESGFEINTHASVFELCKPKTAARLLNTQPELSVLMPCRISVYEKDGKYFAATPDLKMQLESLVCEKELKGEILDLYKNITTMIKGW